MYLKRFLATLLLIVICHITRFENTVYLDFTGNTATVKVHNNEFSIDTGGSPVMSVTAELQKSMLAESYIVEVDVASSEDPPVNLQHDCFYLFGKCLFGSPWKGDHSNFQPSYGDWTMDIQMSPRFEVLNGKLPQNFSLKTKFLGRGAQSLFFNLQDGHSIVVNLSDGYINNAISLCKDQDCSKNGFNLEPLAVNLSRIANFFSESFLAGFLFYWLVIIIKLIFPAKDPAREISLPYKILVPVLMIMHFALCSYMSVEILDSTPHVSDSAIYYRQAKLLSKFMTEAGPLTQAPFEPYLSNSSELDGNRIVYKHANRFWPALLAPFMKLGIPDLFNPFLSGLCVFAIFILGSRLFTKNIGLIAAIIYSFSPFTVISAGDYMMQTSTLTLYLLGLLSLMYALENKRRFLSLLAGVLITYAFGIRQISIIALSIPAAILIIKYCKTIGKREVMYFLAGSAVILIAFILDNYFLTGEWFVATHKKFHNLSLGFKFIEEGSNSTDANLGDLPQILFGSYRPAILFGFITLPLIFKPSFKLWVIYLFFPCLVFIHLFLPVNGLHGYGPRFLFESVFALFILSACGISFVFESLNKIGRVLIGIICISLFLQNAYLAAKILPQYKSYNGVQSGIIKEIRKLARPKTIFVMEGLYWQTMDQTVSIFDPTFKNIIVINEKEDKSQNKIIEAYPDWSVVRVDYKGIEVLR
jgi:hypothetical protein